MKKRIIIIIVFILALILISYGTINMFTNKDVVDNDKKSEKEIVTDETNLNDLIKSNDDDYEDSSDESLDNTLNRERKVLKDEYCLNDICINNITIFKYNDMNMVLVNGILVNKSSKSINDKFIKINYDTDEGIISNSYYIGNIKASKSISFEAQYNDLNIFSTKSIKLSNPTSDEVEQYSKNIKDGG